MANRYTKLKIDVKKAISLYESGMSQCEVAEELKTTQKVIWARFREVGYKCRKAAKRNQVGENNHMWKGDKAGYSALHYRVYSLRGKADMCDECGRSDEGVYQWANLTGNYSDPYDYKKMCKSCHAKYDKLGDNFKKERRDAI